MSNMIQIDGKDVDYKTLPEQSITALLQRGVNHVLGNEVASKVSAAKKQTKGGDGPDKDDLKYTEADLETLHDTTFDAKVKAILEGTLGVRGPGVTKLSPIDKEMRAVAWDMIVNSPGVKTGKVKLPTGKGSGEARAEMIAKVLGAHGDRVRGVAQTRLDEAASLGDVLA